MLLAFLMMAGFTGALLPCQSNIQDWLAPPPKQFVVAPLPNATALDWLALRRIAIAESGGTVDSMELYREPGKPAVVSVASRHGRPPLGYDAVVLDPYTGKVLGHEGGAASAQFTARIMPFLYELHTSLASGDWGMWLLGVAALFWTVDCFVGFYLTLPAAPRGWWRNWRQAWKMKLPPRSAIRFNFDLHRATGLWLWPMLFVFAWSSVGMNLRVIYDPVMSALTDYEAPQNPAKAAKSPLPLLDFEPALELARRAVKEEASRRGFAIEREREFALDRENNMMRYVVRTSLDLADWRYANSYFMLDARTGRIISEDLPTGQHSGNTVGYWLSILHTAGIGGLPYRIFVSLVAVMVFTLSLTGGLIWMKKRAARLSGKQKRRQRKNVPLAVG